MPQSVDRTDLAAGSPDWVVVDMIAADKLDLAAGNLDPAAHRILDTPPAADKLDWTAPDTHYWYLIASRSD